MNLDLKNPKYQGNEMTNHSLGENIYKRYLMKDCYTKSATNLKLNKGK